MKSIHFIHCVHQNPNLKISLEFRCDWLRLESSFDTVLFEGSTESVDADNRVEIAQLDDANDDERGANVVNLMMEDQVEHNDEHIAEDHMKSEPAVKNEMEDEVALPLVEFDPNEASHRSSAIETAATACIQSQPSSSSQTQEILKRIAFKCNDCQYVAQQQWLLKRHQLIHEDRGTSKSFKCKQCKFSFRHKSSLKRHERSHIWQKLIHQNDQRLFKCEQCMRSFTQKSERDTHEARCRGRHYECYLCKTHVTIHVSAMQRHMRTHTGVKPFLCSICSMGFQQKGKLKRHSSLIHQLK